MGQWIDFFQLAIYKLFRAIRSSVHLFACTTHLFVCSALLASLVRPFELIHSPGHSRAHGKVIWRWFECVDFISSRHLPTAYSPVIMPKIIRSQPVQSRFVDSNNHDDSDDKTQHGFIIAQEDKKHWLTCHVALGAIWMSWWHQCIISLPDRGLLRSTRTYDASIRQKHDMIQLSYNTSTRWSSNYAAVQSKGDSFQRMFRLTIADWLRRSEDSSSRQPSSVVIDGGYWAAE